MTNTSKPNKGNWFDQITPEVLGRVGASSASEGGDFAQTGSICTSRRDPPPETLPPRTNNGRTEYRPDPQALRNAGFSEQEIKERMGGRT
jgi:hypothetical protein